MQYVRILISLLAALEQLAAAREDGKITVDEVYDVLAKAFEVSVKL